MLKISEFIELVNDPNFFKVEVFDVISNEIVYEGDIGDMPEQFMENEIMGIDSPFEDKLYLNIEVEE